MNFHLITNEEWEEMQDELSEECQVYEEIENEYDILNCKGQQIKCEIISYRLPIHMTEFETKEQLIKQFLQSIPESTKTHLDKHIFECDLTCGTKIYSIDCVTIEDKCYFILFGNILIKYLNVDSYLHLKYNRYRRYSYPIIDYSDSFQELLHIENNNAILNFSQCPLYERKKFDYSTHSCTDISCKNRSFNLKSPNCHLHNKKG